MYHQPSIITLPINQINNNPIYRSIHILIKMQFINVIISLAALGAVANAQFEKRSCVASMLIFWNTMIQQ